MIRSIPIRPGLISGGVTLKPFCSRLAQKYQKGMAPGFVLSSMENELFFTVLTQKPKAHVCHPLHWLPVDVPATEERFGRGAEGRGEGGGWGSPAHSRYTGCPGVRPSIRTMCEGEIPGLDGHLDVTKKARRCQDVGVFRNDLHLKVGKN